MDSGMGMGMMRSWHRGGNRGFARSDWCRCLTIVIKVPDRRQRDAASGVRDTRKGRL